jgi:O-antigen/teichoic acid export membrane protein
VLQVIVLARLLSPADFGLMAITASLLVVLGLFTDIGLSRAVIHYETISEDALTSLFWLNLIAGAILSVLFAIAAPGLAALFRLDGLAPVLLATSPVFLLSAIGQQFRTLAEKEFRFSKLALNEITSGLLAFMISVTIALRGGGVYALVAAALTTAAVNSILAWLRLSSGHRPYWHFRFAETRRFLRFGGYLVGEGLLNTIIRQADVLVGGLNVSSAMLGIYSVPRDLSMRVGMTINPIITRVGFPVMSRLQGDTAALKSVYAQTLRMTASVNFPIYIAMSLFAEEIVALLYGPHWRGARIYLQLLAVWGLLRSTGNPVGSLLHAVGKVKLAFWWNAVLFALLPCTYWIVTHNGGLIALALTLIIVYTILIPASWYYLVRPCCNIGIKEYMAQLMVPLLLSLVAGMGAWLITRGIPHGTLRLALGGLIGGIIYLGLSRLFNQTWFDAMRTLFRIPNRIVDF